MTLPKDVTSEPDRHGNPRLYYRRGHGKRVRLRIMPGHPEFMAAYEAAKAGREWAAGTGVKAGIKPAAGTLRALALAYYKSPDWATLDATTRAKRRAIIDGCLDEAIFPNPADLVGECPAPLFKPEFLQRLLDKKAGKPEASNGRVKAMRRLFAWGKINPNPTAGFKLAKSVTGGHHTWTIGEVEAYWAAHPVGTKARLVMDIFMFTGLRISDAARFGRQHARQGVVQITQHKNRARGRKVLEFPILPALAASIAACPSKGLTFIETAWGTAHTAKGLGNSVRKWCDEAGLPHCSAHGLRKAGATFAAENGATEQQLMAIFGWEDPRVAATYVRAANRAKMAAMAMHLIAPNPSPENHVREKAEKA